MFRWAHDALWRMQHPSYFIAGGIPSGTARARGGVPASEWAVNDPVHLESDRPQAASALLRQGIGQKAGVAHLPADPDRAGIEVAAHVRIAWVGAAAVDLQRQAIHLTAGLGYAGNRHAHRLRLSRRPEAEGEFVELRSGVVAVVGFHIGAGLLKRNGARLQPDDQAGGDPIHMV